MQHLSKLRALLAGATAGPFSCFKDGSVIKSPMGNIALVCKPDRYMDGNRRVNAAVLCLLRNCGEELVAVAECAKTEHAARFAHGNHEHEGESYEVLTLRLLDAHAATADALSALEKKLEACDG